MYNVWIVPDLRRTTDLAFFRNHYKNIITVRINASLEVRVQRGFVFTSGIDDEESECGLDDIYDWDLIINNDCDSLSLDKCIDTLVQSIN